MPPVDMELQAAASALAERLGEHEALPRQQILHIVELCGPEFARAMADQAEQVEAEGGLMLADRDRRRTLGGVFFYLVRTNIDRDLRRRIYAMAKAETTQPKAQRMAQDLLPFEWDTRASVIHGLTELQGEAESVKITLIGRPGAVNSDHKDLVITTMRHDAKSATLPKGVPQPPEDPTLYTVYISAKQWAKVESAVANPDDPLIVEGLCALDPEIGVVAVYAQSVTTKQLEQSKRSAKEKEPRPAAAPRAPKPRSMERLAERPSGARRREEARALPMIELPPAPSPALPRPAAVQDSNGMPDDVAQRLTELYASASLFRQKIKALSSKPAGQQSGLDMTRKLLKQAEDEIAVLERRYKR